MKKFILSLSLSLFSFQVFAINGLILECKKGSVVTDYFEYKLTTKQRIKNKIDDYRSEIDVYISNEYGLDSKELHFFNDSMIWVYEGDYLYKEPGQWMIGRETGEMKRDVRECESLSESEKMMGRLRDDHPCQPHNRNLRDKHLGYCTSISSQKLKLGKRDIYKPTVKKKRKF